MRFVNPFSLGRSFLFARKSSDWPLALRFAMLILPAGICIAFIAIWMGYRAASTSLADSLESLPLFEAKFQAEKMTTTLQQLRHSLSRIAQFETINAQSLYSNISLYFQNNADLVQEIGFKDTNGNGFMLLRDEQGFTELNAAESSQGPYSPFQQIAAGQSSQKRGAVLYPAVFFYPPRFEGKEHFQRRPVMRMTVPRADGSGILVLGINLEDWRNQLAVYTRADSPLRLPLQEGALQIAYFFDSSGWVLFEMDSDGGGSYLPDAARRGYRGDLGRPGFDAAFRPWGVHEDFWRMVTDVMAERSGTIPMAADAYAPAQVTASGVLAYAPVFFSPTEGSAPGAVGGIAFFETSTLPLSALLRLANTSLMVCVCALILFSLLAARASKILAGPFRRISFNLKKMSETGEYYSVEEAPACEEHQKLQAAVNSIVSRAMVMQGDVERITREIQYARSRLPVDLTQMLSKPPPDAEFGLVGTSPLIEEVREQVRKAARAGTDVLIWGETGTGKELVAAAIHKASARCKGAYLSINCGALDENLLLDALFGHVKGAFSEAKADRKGAFLAAAGGTLHLDEVANASFKVQQSLLRALSVRRIRPLGTDEEVPFNTRVVAATNVDLRECVRAGTFREDLYYRLAIISIETPPLRHRKEDIPELAAFCLHEAASSMARPEARLSRGALEVMLAHDWPGNVREFKNCLIRAMAFVEDDLILQQHITLEQDAFRTYGKPISLQVLAGKMHLYPMPGLEPGGGGSVGSGISGLGMPGPGGQPQGSVSAGDLSGAAEKSKPVDPASQRETHAAEYLWPAPPRSVFTPARSEQPQNGSDGSPTPEDETGRAGQGKNSFGVLGQALSVPPETAAGPEPTGSGSGGWSDPAVFDPVESAKRTRPQTPSPGGDSYVLSGSRYLLPENALAANGVPGAYPLIPGSAPARLSGQAVERGAGFGAAYRENGADPRGLGHFFPHGARAPATPDRAGNGKNGREGDASLPQVEKQAAQLNERQVRALEFIQNSGDITRTQYEAVTGQEVSSRTAQNDLRELVELGLLERVGAGPGTRYMLRRQTG